MEATVVCVDNSESTRNGDFEPSRFQAQSDAINLLAGAKTGANPENTVGVLTCATVGSKAPRVMVTPTPDLGKVLTAMSDIIIEGSIDVCKSAQKAQLALKHRQNKNQRQRLVMFVGSLVNEPVELLTKVGKSLRKSNVSVDVVSFGDCSERNKEVLEAFVAAVNKDANSHYVEAPPGSNLSDFLLSTPVVSQGGGGGGDGEGAGGEGAAPAGFEFGVDPNMDPELAMVLRMSMEEERARQAQAQAAADAANAAAGGATPATPATTAAPIATPAAPMAGGAAPAADAGGAQAMDEDEDDALLQQALAMSVQETTVAPAEAAETGVAAMDEDPEMAAAIAMSLAADAPSSSQAIAESMQGLPGVDMNNPDVQRAIADAAAAVDKGEGKPGDTPDDKPDQS